MTARTGTESDKNRSRTGKFLPGNRANPRGRPRGIQDRRVAFRAMLEQQEPKALTQIVAALVAKAKDGDVAAARAILERTFAPLKPRSEPVELAPITGTNTEQATAIVRQIASGDLSPDDGREILQALGAATQIAEHDELARRVDTLAEQVKQIIGRRNGDATSKN